MTERLFLERSDLLEFDATVVARRQHEGRPAVVLDRTAFYAESGGQPWDTGTLGEAQVVAVVESGGEILHLLDRPLAVERVHGRVHAERRRDHLQQHHGQHLLSRAFVQVARAETIAFHLGSELTTIDLDRPVGDDEARAAERLANEVVWQARPVRISTISTEAARAERLEVPGGVAGAVRVVDVEGFDRQPCGGTHPRTTAEVGVVLITGLEKFKAGTRVAFVCGHRALTAFDRRRQVLEELVSTLSAPLEELTAVARKARLDLAEGERRARGLVERAIEGDARRLLEAARAETKAPGSPAVVVTALEGWAPGELRTLGSRIVEQARAIALLGSRAEGKAHLVFAQSEGLPHDVPALLKASLEVLGGRGGGRGNLAQGGGDRLERLEEALALAESSVRAR
ncbi:MAG TPA: alanyl-tRNA editing protein [Vicinamibacteria bacterium]|nr:alanyl-tRNA editing protein [Vicinamibacteria bacterium]